MIKALLGLALLATSGCASGVVLTDLDHSFRLLIIAVQKNLPNGVLSQSSNSREWVSQYFVVANERILDKSALETAPERRQAVVTILGDRRPYRIQVVVESERREENRRGEDRFKRAGRDKQTADLIATRIETFLAQSRERRDLIDDFRAF